MRVVFIGFVFSLFCITSYSQQNFSLAIPLADTQTIQAVFATPVDDGFYLAGQYLTYSPTDFNSSFSIYKFDNAHEVAWKKDAMPINNELFFQMLSSNPLLTLDNKLFVANSFKDNDWSEYATARCYEESGTQKWKSNFYLPIGYSASLLSKNKYNKNITLIGITYPTSSPEPGWPGVWYNIDTIGEVVDSVLFHLPMPNNDREYEIIEKAQWLDSSLIVKVAFSEFNGSTLKQGVLLTSFNWNGSLKWQKEYFTNVPVPETFAIDPVNNHIFVPFLTSSNTYCLKIFDYNGNLVSQMCETDNSVDVSYYISISNMFSDNEGSVFMLENKSYNYSSVIKFNNDGVKVWEKRIQNQTFNDSIPKFILYGEAGENGSLLLSGFINAKPSNQDPSTNSYLYWVVSLDKEGCFNGICSDTIFINSPVVSVTQAGSNKPDGTVMHVWPNPAGAIINIKINVPTDNFDDKYSVLLTNILGEVVQSTDVQLEQPEILKISTLSAGVYFISLISEKQGFITTSRFIKQ